MANERVDVLAVLSRLEAPTARQSVLCDDVSRVYAAVEELIEAAKRAHVLIAGNEAHLTDKLSIPRRLAAALARVGGAQ